MIRFQNDVEFACFARDCLKIEPSKIAVLMRRILDRRLMEKDAIPVVDYDPFHITSYVGKRPGDTLVHYNRHVKDTVAGKQKGRIVVQHLFVPQ